MATIRESNHSALLVVDVQVGVVRTAWDVPRIIGNIQSSRSKKLVRKTFPSSGCSTRTMTWSLAARSGNGCRNWCPRKRDPYS